MWGFSLMTGVPVMTYGKMRFTTPQDLFFQVESTYIPAQTKTFLRIGCQNTNGIYVWGRQTTVEL